MSKSMAHNYKESLEVLRQKFSEKSEISAMEDKNSFTIFRFIKRKIEHKIAEPTFQFIYFMENV